VLGRTLFIPLIQSATAGALRLAAMTPGFLEGEDRHYPAYVSLKEAENAYPNHQIVEARVPREWIDRHGTLHQMTAIRGVVSKLHGIDTDARDYKFDLRADLPATYIVGLREPRAARLSDPKRHGGPHPLSPEGLEMLNLCDTALRIARNLDKLTERLVYDIANSPEWNKAQVDGFYDKLPGLANWRKAGGAAATHLIFGTADEATRQEKIAAVKQGLEDLERLTVALEAPYTSAYLENVRERVLLAKKELLPISPDDASEQEAAKRIGRAGDLIGGTRRSREDTGVIGELEGLLENLGGTYGVDTAEAATAREAVKQGLYEWRVANGYIEEEEEGPPEDAVGSERITDSQMAHMERRHVSVNRLPS
jgi:hypothetical protein